MKYISLDTCVWMRLLEIDFNNDDNIFEELFYWIEGKCVTHIAPENVIVEWHRNKISSKEAAVKVLRDNENLLFSKFKNDSNLLNTYNPDRISQIIQLRIDRIDTVLENSEKAKINDKILVEAGRRNLNKRPPNHIKEGYKDTVNILSLINHLRLKQYNNCIFTTVDGDFSINKSKPTELHTDLIPEFKEANLEFIFFGNKKNIDDTGNSLGAYFFNVLRRVLPSFQNHLKQKVRDEKERELHERKALFLNNVIVHDNDFLENIKYIDFILDKRNHTTWELEMIKSLIERHDSYKQYFFTNIGNNGMV